MVELAASDWQPPRGKGNKGHQQNVQAAITGESLQAACICPSAMCLMLVLRWLFRLGTDLLANAAHELLKIQSWLCAGILAKPFLLAQSNAAAAREALSQLLAVCLSRKQTHLSSLLADVICMVHAEAAEAAVSMLAAVADYATTGAHAAPHAMAKKQKDQKADHAHQQAAALAVLLEYASKGEEQQMVMLELFSCKVNTTEICSARRDTSYVTCCITMLFLHRPILWY